MKRKEQQICQKIYEENVERILWYLRRRYSWLEESDIYDIMQDTWKVMCEHIHDLEGRSEPERWAWLITVTKNNVISWIRSKARKEELEEKVQDRFGKLSCFTSTEEVALQKITAEGVLDKLSSREREILLSKYFKTAVTDEDEERKNAKNCKRYRARKKLQEYMKEGGMDE